MSNFFFLQGFVDNAFKKSSVVDTDKVSYNFQLYLKSAISDAQLAEILICTGFIPDLYGADSSQETLFSKLVEVLVCEWATRMGFPSYCVKQKASFEDVNISLNGKTIVCDAKSFRLGRSQQAPNVKDFLKLEDIRKWLQRYPHKLGGLVTYPDTHEWARGSDAYQYCNTKDAPTLMLPYKYLSFLLKFKSRYNVINLEQLWDYNRIFSQPLKKTMSGGNRAAYWKVINAEIIRLTNTDRSEFSKYITYCDSMIREFVNANLHNLEYMRYRTVQRITNEVKSEDVEALQQKLISYRIKSETSLFDALIKRINNFRL